MKTVVLFSIITISILSGISFITCAENEGGEPSVKSENLSMDFIQICGEDDDPLPIRGTVKNTSGGNLANVHVELYTLELEFVDDDYTATDGSYLINNVVPDTYKLFFNKAGYEELIKTVVVVGGNPYFDVGIDQLVEE